MHNLLAKWLACKINLYGYSRDNQSPPGSGSLLPKFVLCVKKNILKTIVPLVCTGSKEQYEGMNIWLLPDPNLQCIHFGREACLDHRKSKEFII